MVFFAGNKADRINHKMNVQIRRVGMDCKYYLKPLVKIPVGQMVRNGNDLTHSKTIHIFIWLEGNDFMACSETGRVFKYGLGFEKFFDEVFYRAFWREAKVSDIGRRKTIGAASTCNIS